MQGLKISKLTSNGQGTASGMLEGDILHSYNGHPIKTGDALRAAQKGSESYESVDVNVTRGDEVLTLTIEPTKPLGIEFFEVNAAGDIAHNTQSGHAMPMISALLVFIAIITLASGGYLAFQAESAADKAMLLTSGIVQFSLLSGLAAAIHYLKGIYLNTRPGQ